MNKELSNYLSSCEPNLTGETRDMLAQIKTRLPLLSNDDKTKILEGFLVEDCEDDGWYINYLYYVMSSVQLI